MGAILERHRCTARRIEQLLSDLGEAVEEGDRDA